MSLSAKSSPLPRTEMDALLLGRLDELTVNEPSSKGRSLLGIVLSIIVLCIISTLIVAAIILMNPDIASQFGRRRQAAREAISLEEVVTGALSPRPFEGSWQADSQGADQLLYEESKNLYLLSLTAENLARLRGTSEEFPNFVKNARQVAAGAGGSSPAPQVGDRNNLQAANRNLFAQAKVRTLISSSGLLSSIDYQGVRLSPSKKFLLLWTSQRQQFRHTFTAKYFLYDLERDLISILSTGPPQPPSGGDSGDGGEPVPTPSDPSKSPHNNYESLDSASLYLNDASGGGLADFQQQPYATEGAHELERRVRFQMVEWFDRPEGGEDSLLLVQDNDLFVLTDIAKLDGRPPRRLTHTGKPGLIYNGVPDWLYEEEILSSSSGGPSTVGAAAAHEISPDGQHLAYLSINDSLVSELPISWYGGEQVTIPRVQMVRYPLAGTPNPTVHLHVIERFWHQNTGRDGGESTRVELPRELASQQHYLYRIKWLTSHRLGLIWTNRHQNESQVLVCAPSDSGRNAEGPHERAQGKWSCTRSLTIGAPGGWLDTGDDLFRLDENSYLALVPKFEGEQVGTFKHLARVSLSQPDEFTFLTRGKREVLRVEGVDAKRALVYYTSSLEGEPGQRHLFATSLARGHTELDLCLTCDLYPGECLSNEVELSPSMRHFIFRCNGPQVPRIELREFLFADQEEEERNFSPFKSQKFEPRTAAVGSRLVSLIEDNEELREKLASSKAMPETIRLRVPIPNTNYLASVLLLLPPLLGPTTTFQRNPPGSAGSQTTSFFGPEPSLARYKRDSEHSNDTAPTWSQTHAEGLERIRQYVKQMPSGGGGAAAATNGGAGGNNHPAPPFPMVVEVYAGPNSQRVDFQMAIQVGHYFASARRTVYAMIDGRGSAREGSRRAFEMFGRFGQVEVEDQIQVTRELVSRAGPLAGLVDPTKVAIWGWSYGGYAAAMALARSNRESLQRTVAQNLVQDVVAPPIQSSFVINQGQEPRAGRSQASEVAARRPQVLPPVRSVFECAASMAPITNLIYYDTAYSERYLRSPWRNERYDRHVLGDHLDQEQVADREKVDEPVGANIWQHWANQTGEPQQGANHKRPRTIEEDLNERYRSSDLLEHIADIDRKRFLLMHGTADDNVHIQNSFRLMKQLIKRNIPFETRLYPDQRHSITDYASQLDLFNMLGNFFAECFEMAH